MHRRVLSYGCFCFALFILFVYNGSLILSAKNTQTTQLPSVSAQSAILIESISGEVAYEKNAHTRMPMASTTKIMTAIVAMELGDPTMMVEIPREAVGVEGSSIYLYEGERLSLEHLLYALLLESANDAAVAIAVALSGTEDAFVEKMNQKAEALGLSDTHFTNPHGLDHEEHYTSAADLARLAAYCIHNELFRTIVSTRRITIPLNDQEGARLLLNHNRLLRSYDGTIGLKTGFTKRSGRCLVSAAERDGVTMIAVTLNAPDDWNDHRNMLDYGFSQYTALLLQASGSYERAIPLVGMPQPEIIISNQNDIRVILPSDHGPIRMYCEAPRWLGGNISKGQVLGHLIWECDGNTIAIEPLLAQSSVSVSPRKQSFWARFLSLFI